MPFQRFEKTHTPFEDRITITRSKGVGLPAKFYQQEGISQYKHVVLYYDQETDSVGVQFTNDSEQRGRFSINSSGKNYGGYVSASSFFKANSIDAERARGRYDWKKVSLRDAGFDQDGELYVIKLVRKDPPRKEAENEMPS